MVGVVTGRSLLRAAARGGEDIRTRYDRGMPDAAHGTLHTAIAASIAAHPAIARLGAAPLPDPHAVARLVAAFREIAFPGFHPLPRGTDHVDVDAFVAERIPVLRALLVQLVDACLEAAPAAGGKGPPVTPATDSEAAPRSRPATECPAAGRSCAQDTRGPAGRMQPRV